MHSETSKRESAPGAHHCVARTVVEALGQNPTLEAVTIDRSQRTISVATLGQADALALTGHITTRFEAAQAAATERGCVLLTGGGDCQRCSGGLTPEDSRKIVIQHEAERTTISRVTCPTAPRFWRWRQIPWPKIVQREVEFFEHEEDIDEWKAQMAAALLCGASGLSAYFLNGKPGLSLALFILAYVAGSWHTAQEVWERLRQRAVDVHFLMLAVAAGSAAIGAWGEGAMLLFLFSFSGALEHYAMGRTQREIRSLFREAPKTATVVDSTGLEEEVPVERLRPGMRLLVKPGAQFAVDAEITKGKTASDESTLTGEAAPVEKEVGDTVFAGTINLWGAVEAVVLRSAGQSSLQKIIQLIREAQRQKAPAQRFTDRFGSVYTYSVLGLSLAMFFIWWLGFGQKPFARGATGHSAFYHAMTLLVVASPCALVLSIPSAVLAAIAWGARHGVLFRGGAAVEKLAEANVVALDKTGTLTTGELRVEAVTSFPPGREQEVAQLAYSLERLSTHPLARAITRYGKQQNLGVTEFDHFESVTGQGLQAQHKGTVCRLGRQEWVVENTANDAVAAPPPMSAGLSEIWLRFGDLAGRLVLRDDLRPEARELIKQLGQEKLRTIVLTGDRKEAAEHLRGELELEDIRAGMKPQEKLAAIQALTAKGDKVAMVGDGVNDAPSLAAAHIGVAMGARGSDAALEQADVVLMHDRLENFLAAFRLSQRARRIIRQNLVISLGTVVVLVGFALAGRIPLTLGVIGHEGSTVIVVMNSLRLLLGKQK